MVQRNTPDCCYKNGWSVEVVLRNTLDCRIAEWRGLIGCGGFFEKESCFNGLNPVVNTWEWSKEDIKLVKGGSPDNALTRQCLSQSSFLDSPS